MNPNERFLYTNHFHLDRIEDILKKKYGNEIVFEEEQDVDAGYARIHGPITTVRYLKARVPTALFNEQRACRRQLDFLARGIIM